jgi:hypothetical protein
MRITTAIAIGAILLGTAAYMGARRMSGSGFGFGTPDDGCELTDEPSDDGVVMVRAVCHWEKTSADRLNDLLRDPSIHQQFFSNLAESTVLGEKDGVTLVRQVHQASGMSDREIVVEWRAEPVHGGYKYHWQKSADQSANSRTRVEVAESTGYWEIVKEGEGTRVGYQVRYLPGGNIPGFLVRMFQSGGMRGVLADLREAADSDTIVVKAEAQAP